MPINIPNYTDIKSDIAYTNLYGRLIGYRLELSSNGLGCEIKIAISKNQAASNQDKFHDTKIIPINPNDLEVSGVKLHVIIRNAVEGWLKNNAATPFPGATDA